MRCVTCNAPLCKEWKELVIDVDRPQCGFCDGTVFLMDLVRRD